MRNLRRHQLFYLDALLTFGSVTQAAKYLGVSQPTMSTALAQLRDHYSDELLLRVGNQYGLTPLGSELQPLVSEACVAMDRVFSWASDFEAGDTDREFSLSSSDFGGSVLGPQVLSIMQQEAPQARMKIVRPNLAHVRRPHEGLRTVDGMLMPKDVMSELPHLDLLADEWVCVAAKGNDQIGEQVTLKEIVKLPWVVTDLRIPIAAHRALELMGVKPRIVARSEAFMVTAALVSGSERLAIVQGSVARLMAEQFELRVFPCPFPVPPIVYSLWWHPFLSNDEGHQWWRSCFQRAAAKIRERNAAVRSD